MSLFLGRRNSSLLQVLDLPSTTEAPFAPTSKVTVDSVIERDGWLALTHNMQAWSLPCVAGSKPTLLKSGRHPAPHQDPSLLWLNTEALAIAVDGSGRPTGEQIALPPDSWLRSSTDGICVFWNPNRGSSLLARPGEAAIELPGMYLDYTFGPHALLHELGRPRLHQLDLQTGLTNEIKAPGSGAWDRLSVQSPDQAMVALTLTLDPPPEREPGMSIEEWIQVVRAQPPRDPGSMVGVLNLATGSTRMSSTILPTAFTPTLAWTSDSLHVALKTHDTKTASTQAVYGWMDLVSLKLGLIPTTSGTASPHVDIGNWYSA